MLHKSTHNCAMQCNEILHLIQHNITRTVQFEHRLLEYNIALHITSVHLLQQATHDFCLRVVFSGTRHRTSCQSNWVPKCPAACSLLLKCSTHSAQATLLLYQMVCHCIGPLKLFSGPLLPTFGEPQLSLFKQGSPLPSKVPNIFILAYIVCQNVSPKNCTPLTIL